MAFWIAATVLIVLATASIAVPFLRAPKVGATALDFDRELYLARIAEIDSDLELGRIGKSEAEAARAEEGRKLIALSAAQDAAAAVGNAGLSRFAFIVAAAFVPASAVVFYSLSGVPNMPDMAIASRADRDLSRQSIGQLLEHAEAQLASNPDDVRGWRVVAPVYERLGRFDDAVTAWRNALRLEPEDPELSASLGQAITMASGGIVTEEARELFDAALAARPGDARARFFIAVALGQQGEVEAARQAWFALIADAPADAPWLSAARAQLQSLGGAAPDDGGPDAAPGAGPGPVAALPGPTQQDVEAASRMSIADRQAMIETMVANLADKLKQNPQDRAGWRRLVRSYAILGKREEAARAIVDAKTHFSGDAEFLAELEAMLGPAPSGATQ